jgi:hypothetical protein
MELVLLLVAVCVLPISIALTVRFWQLIWNLAAWQKRQIELQEKMVKNLERLVAAAEGAKLQQEQMPKSLAMPSPASTESEGDHCSNCGRMIGRLEVTHLWQDHAVCTACRSSLESQKKSEP